MSEANSVPQTRDWVPSSSEAGPTPRIGTLKGASEPRGRVPPPAFPARLPHTGPSASPSKRSACLVGSLMKEFGERVFCFHEKYDLTSLTIIF